MPSTTIDEPDPFDAIVDAPFDSALSERYLVYPLRTQTVKASPSKTSRLMMDARLLKLWPRGCVPNTEDRKFLASDIA